MNRPTTLQDCEGKFRFNSFRKAARAAGRMAKRESIPMHAYACQVCGGHHVGSTTGDSDKMVKGKMR